MDSKNHILDEIITTVDKNGSHEVPLKVLEETVFKPTHQPYRSTAEQVLIWAVESRINYEYKNIDNEAIVRFYKKIDPGETRSHERKYREGSHFDHCRLLPVAVDFHINCPIQHFPLK